MSDKNTAPEGMRAIRLENGKELLFDKNTSDEDIANALEGYRSDEFKEYGKKKPFGMDYTGGVNPPSKAVNLKMTGTPEPEPEGEGYLMERSAIDATSMAGGFAGAKMGFDMAPAQYKPAASLVGGAIGSGIGAFGGTYAQQGIQGYNNSPLSDRNATEVLGQALEEGGEAALFDLVLGGAFQGTARGWRYMTSPRGRQDLSKLQGMLKSSGTTLTMGQVLDDTMMGSVMRGTEEILRGAAWTRGPYARINKAQDTAFFGYVRNVADSITESATKGFKPGMFGRYVKAVAKRGERLHSEASSLLFEQLDNATPLITKTEVIKGGVETGVAPGNKILRMTPQMKEGVRLVQQGPVDVSHIRSLAKKTSEELKKLGLPETAKEGYGILTNMASGVDHLTFVETHKLLSGLKRMQRSGKLKGDPGSVELGSLIKQVDEAFTKGGNALGGDITKQYKAAREFYKVGKESFNNELITKLLAKSPSRIGRSLAKEATVEDIDAVRRMVLQASKQKGSRINFQETMRKITYGVVEELLPRTKEGFDNAPIFKIAKDADLEDRMISFIGKENTNTLKKATSILDEMLHARGEKGAGTSRQLGTLSQWATTGGVAGAAGSSALIGVAPSLMAFFAVPAAASRLFTSPKFVNYMATFQKAPLGSAARRKLTVKMMSFANNVRRDLEKEQQESDESPDPTE